MSHLLQDDFALDGGSVIVPSVSPKPKGMEEGNTNEENMTNEENIQQTSREETDDKPEESTETAK